LRGDGVRLFGDLGREHPNLEIVRVTDSPGVTHVRYRVAR
jgi:hypothetical protein